MKRNIFFTTAFLLLTQLLPAQRKEINSFGDLPAINYSTTSLKTGSKSNTDAWIKNIAVTELKHIDSVLKYYTIGNANVNLNLVVTKLNCNFIKGDWEDVKHADTIFRNFAQLPPAFKKAGMSHLSSYAETKLNPAPDFNKNYIRFFDEAIKTLTGTEKAIYVGYIIKLFNDAPEGFEKNLQKIRALPVVADTLPMVFSLLSDYVYKQIGVGASKQLSTYLNESIKNNFTRADTLRGTINEERAWWNVLHYSITVKPDYANKSITGKNEIQYQVTKDSYPAFMQIDLQEPLVIDSVLFNDSRKLSFTKDGNAWHVAVPKQPKLSIDSVLVYYHGTPREAVNPPWDGGWIWATDSLGNPWMSVACQGLGASVWYPCKDHQSDEPDNGASLSMIIPDSLVGVANGRLYSKNGNNDGTTTYTWGVVNPINNYDIIPYIGKYVNYSEVYDGLKGKLDVNYWVLNYNLERAKEHMVPEVHRMLKSHEYWMGPYPFYEDGYKLVDAPHLGMEHQSAVAYGNKYMNGYLGQDLSGSGWGLKWDYIIIHESGHEWFGNNITTDDIADMWVHEGFTAYSETLFTEYYYGKEAGNEYTIGTREGIQNVFPVIGYYGVNDDVSIRNGDMYNKGSNMLQTIRHSMSNDSLFREILIGLNKTFYHKTVTSSQVEKYISDHAGFDYSKVFDQYLRNIDIPQLEFYFASDGSSFSYRYTNCIKGFNLPLVLRQRANSMKIFPGTEWKTVAVAGNEGFFDEKEIEKMYYIGAKKVERK